jgi:hypothetical protein
LSDNLRENDDWDARCAEAYQLLGEISDELIDKMGEGHWLRIMDILSGMEMFYSDQEKWVAVVGSRGELE